MGLSACELDFRMLEFRRKRRSSRSPGSPVSCTAILLWLWAVSWPCRRTATWGHPSATSATFTTWFSFPWRAWAAVCPRRWCPVPPLDSLARGCSRSLLRPVQALHSEARIRRRGRPGRRAPSLHSLARSHGRSRGSGGKWASGRRRRRRPLNSSRSSRRRRPLNSSRSRCRRLRRCLRQGHHRRRGPPAARQSQASDPSLQQWSSPNPPCRLPGMSPG